MSVVDCIELKGKRSQDEGKPLDPVEGDAAIAEIWKLVCVRER